MKLRDRPPVLLGALEFARLHSLLGTKLRERFAEGAAQLRRTLMRATILPSSVLPDDVVGVGAELVFREDGDCYWSEGTLVYPWDERPDGRTISVFSPLGASLLGRGIGGHGSYRGEDGRVFSWTVAGVWWAERLRSRVA